MAYIENDKLLDENDPNKQLQQGQQAQAATPMVGGGSNQVGNNVSTAGVGAGGAGGWTNIQSYLQANQGDTGSAKNLQDTVGGQFEKEKTDLTGAANTAKTQAKSQVDSQVKTQDAGNILNQAAQQYDYNGNHQQGYQDNVSKVQNTINGQYSGPQNFSYNLGNQTQQYGTNLADKGGFDSLMNGIYSQKAGKGLSTGQFNLQKQLDTGNEALEQTKGNLLNEYTGLNSLLGSTVQDTNQFVGQAANDYRTNQSALRDWLGNKQSSLGTELTAEEIKARDAIKSAYDAGSGMSNLGYDTAAAKDALLGGGRDWNRFEIGKQRAQSGYADGSLYGDNRTFRQLEEEQKGIDSGKLQDWTDYNSRGGYGGGLGGFSQLNNVQDFDENGNVVGEHQEGSGPTFGELLNQERTKKRGAVTNFWDDKTKTYGNTGDSQKRQYNALLDFLSSQEAKKAQGFNVKEGI